jgi:hypothetical protein
MPTTYQLRLGGTPAEDALYDKLTALEVEESLDVPGAVQFTLPVDRTQDGDLSFVGDPRLGPLAPVAVVAEAEAGKHCVFDGVVLAHAAKLTAGVAGSSVQVWGQDATWLMNAEEKVREFVGLDDAAVAATILGEYGIAPAPENGADPSPTHPESGHTLMQRGTDYQFLRALARRTGKLFRVFCRDRAGQRVGYFAKPALEADPVLVLTPNDPVAPNAGNLDLRWDVARPTQVLAHQALFSDTSPDGVPGTATEPGLALLDERGLEAFAGQPNTALLTAPADTAGELLQRAQAVLREAGWFVRGECEVTAARVNVILRAGDLVRIDGVGQLHSGRYLVWSVRHTITRDVHRMKLVLVRNAVGPAPSGGLLP